MGKRVLMTVVMFVAWAIVVNVVLLLVTDVEDPARGTVALIGGLVAAGFYWWKTRPKPEIDTSE